jgi:hypothetical protein
MKSTRLRKCDFSYVLLFMAQRQQLVGFRRQKGSVAAVAVLQRFFPVIATQCAGAGQKPLTGLI